MATADVPRFLHDPFVAEEDPDNPDGLVLNTGELISFGDTNLVLDEFLRQDRDLLGEYMECKCDKLRSDSETTEGLFDLPDCYVLFTTYYHEILPSLYDDDEVDAENLELPYTTVESFPKPLIKVFRDRLAWVLGES